MKIIHSLFLLLFPLFLWSQTNIPIQAEVTWADEEVSLEQIFVQLETSGGNEVAYAKMQNKIDYVGKDSIRRSLRPKDVERIEFDYGDAYHVLISTFFASNYYMMPAEVDNKLRVLRYYPTVAAEGEALFETDEVNIRVLSIEGDNQGDNTKIFRVGFRKSMLELFDDYPEMQKKIKDRTFTYDNWEEMVGYFNLQYGESDL